MRIARKQFPVVWLVLMQALRTYIVVLFVVTAVKTADATEFNLLENTNIGLSARYN
jgi:hypothetical protein